MLRLRITICGDGPSDRALIEPTRWLVSEIVGDRSATYEVLFAEVKATPLAERVRESARLYPCDVLVVHRDAEAELPARRVAEIETARSLARVTETIVPVVPVRMTEAWLLFDQTAIRRAADNPNETVELGLPRLAQIEAVIDPKDLLREVLARASEKRARRLKMFRAEMRSRIHRVATLVETYAPLRALGSFSRFEHDLRAALEPVLEAASANQS